MAGKSLAMQINLFAIFADVGVMILAILNAIRALYAPSVSIKEDSRKMVLQPQSE